jgi:dTDP-4-dehydrorhamnose 3,5-epimerase
MRFVPTPLAGAFVIELLRKEDERGFFARSFCQREFAAQGLDPALVQCNLSFNRKRGTLRGLHFQIAPHEEAKVVSCIAGALFDVIVDVRPASPTFGRWFSVELDPIERRALYIPKGFAHGFQTLADETTVHYQMSEFFHPASARGLRFDDPALGIPWPLPDPILSDRDAAFPRLSVDAALGRAG